MRSNNFWIILFSGILFICALAAITLFQPNVEWAFIYHDGILIESLDLTKLHGINIIEVENRFGMNVIQIEQGRIRVSESNCPDGFCVKQGWVSGGKIPIVCLPHRLVIEFSDGNKPDIDAITG